MLLRIVRLRRIVRRRRIFRVRFVRMLRDFPITFSRSLMRNIMRFLLFRVLRIIVFRFFICVILLLFFVVLLFVLKLGVSFDYSFASFLSASFGFASDYQSSYIYLPSWCSSSSSASSVFFSYDTYY